MKKATVLLTVAITLVAATGLSAGRTIYVDNDGSADFKTIQAAINDANDGDTVLVANGTYRENIHFDGKNIVLTSAAPEESAIVESTIIDGNEAACVVTFDGAETPACILSGFTITNGSAVAGGGVSGNGAKATIERNLITGNTARGSGIPGSYGAGGGLLDCDGLIQLNIIKDNSAGFGGGLSGCDGVIRRNIISYNRWYSGGGLYACNGIIENNILIGNEAIYGGAIADCDGIIRNCTIVGNTASYAPALTGCSSLICNCIIWANGPDGGPQLENCSTPVYCCIENWDSGGAGNITTEPLFASMGRWQQPSGGNSSSPEWIDNGADYHLQSNAGRWDQNSETWVQDEATSSCIDAGDPMSPVGCEPFPNGGIINMGAYGGTPQASKSYFGGPVCETIVAGDINGDCKVDFADFRLMAAHWLEKHAP
ncbi:MAG: hypothetical protein JSU94_06940 [Phycisphaerales bacterium]|nr:MAG: hypothetical protein JSU94_06940 [Phycisphaerales bacterium]